MIVLFDIGFILKIDENVKLAVPPIFWYVLLRWSRNGTKHIRILKTLIHSQRFK